MSSNAMDFNRKVKQEDYSDDMPAYPAKVLASHATFKGLQVGSLLGVALTPVIAVTRKKQISAAWRGIIVPSTLCGLAIGVGLILLKRDPHNPIELDISGVDDRAHRIANNFAQNRIDQYSAFGATAGALFGAVTGSGVLPTAATGIALGPIYYLVERKVFYDQYYPSIMTQIDKITGRK